MYIDESGDHYYYDYTKTRYNKPSERYLALMGIAMNKDVRKQAHLDLEELKHNHFNSDPDDPIILHRKEIIHKQGPFYVLQDPEKEKAFNNDLIDFLKALDFVLIIVVVDKKHLIETHGKSAYHPYHFALTAMMERYCGYLNFWNSKGDIWAEERGKKEDRKLKEEYLNPFDNGTYYYKPSFFQRALTSKKIKTRSKKANITGLQIADLLVHPCKQRFLLKKEIITHENIKFGKHICDCVKDKYNVQIYSGKIEGYGKVFIG
ncbi:MAG: DUF3800 domain-containing protein [Candidatus Aminicenantes bacterium]|nr:DUF3800 domain-containing protein [Candidatus Aminicenantes bacterium]MBL7083651.1 DUF3800 domain-containing protein [Candidatus Aminicenantes bacterium]